MRLTEPAEPAEPATADDPTHPEPAFELGAVPNEHGYDELIVARDIPFHSLCADHELPFAGVAHVGYVPGGHLVGPSKLARLVEHFAHGPQVQERLTSQVADWLADRLEPRGVGVVLVAEHACMNLRGVRTIGSRAVTSALRGLVRTDRRTRAEFLAAAVGPSGSVSG
jgi:GTP cyclohydrolase I